MFLQDLKPVISIENKHLTKKTMPDSFIQEKGNLSEHQANIAFLHYPKTTGNIKFPYLIKGMYYHYEIYVLTPTCNRVKQYFEISMENNPSNLTHLSLHFEP